MHVPFRVPFDCVTSLSAYVDQKLVGSLSLSMNGGWELTDGGLARRERFDSFAAGVWRLKQLAGRRATWHACASFHPTIDEVDLAADPNGQYFDKGQ